METEAPAITPDGAERLRQLALGLALPFTVRVLSFYFPGGFPSTRGII
jgi:hypothetical protein